MFKKASGLSADLAYYRATSESTKQNRELRAKSKLRILLALSVDQGSIADMRTPLKRSQKMYKGVHKPYPQRSNQKC